ncbi:MAG: phage BR0599 family protein, partial [Pseudomonadota bacterium]
IFSHVCPAQLGDAACGVDLAQTAFHGEGTVVAIDGERRLTASGLDGFESGWFSRGLVRWTGGANFGRAVEVKEHRSADGGALIELWHRQARPVLAGDTFTVTAGCDKHFETCAAKFANTANFRGFPHMPGNDFAVTYPVSGEVHDGSPIR